MASASALGVMLIAGVLIIGLLFSGQIIGMVSNVSPSLGAWLQNLLNQAQAGLQHLGGGTDVVGQVGIGFKICYMDGSYSMVNEINSTSGGGLQPFAIMVNSKPVNFVTCDIWLLIASSGTIGAWNLTTLMVENYYVKSSMATPRFVDSRTIVQANNGWANNTVHEISSYIVYMSALEPRVASYTHSTADWSMRVTTVLSIKLTINGADETLTASPSTEGFDFTYNSGIILPYAITGITSNLAKQ